MTNIKIITVAEAKAMKPSELAKGFVTNCEAGRKAYLTAAVMLVALTALVGVDKATALVKKEGATDSTVKNARYLVRVYEALVIPGHVTEAWFADVLFMDAFAITRALSKVTAKKMADAGVFKRSVKSAYGEFELIFETGMTQPERLAADEMKAADKAAAAEKPAKVDTAPALVEPEESPTVAVEQVPATVAPVVAGKALANLTAVSPTTAAKPSPDPLPVAPVELAKPPASPMAEFADKIDQLEKLAVGIVAKHGDEVTLSRIQERLVALNRAVSTAIEAKTKATKAKKSA